MKNGRKRAKNPYKTLWRIVRCLGMYPVQMPVIFISIFVTAVSGIGAMYYIKPVINDCIVPLIAHENPDFHVFYVKLVQMAGLFATSVTFCLIYNRLAVNVSTGVLCRLREEMFDHMMKLPVRYFDDRPVGENMSLYTNDVDTLREMVSMALPNILFSLVTLTGLFTAMIVLSPTLTGIQCALMLLTLAAVWLIGKKSARYFVRQQDALGRFDAYIEEHISGARVIKVFCREEQTARDFEKHNEALFDAAKNANTYAHILMPVVGNLAYMQYAVIAVCGSILAIAGLTDIGTIAAFLQYTRMASQPVSQVSMQTNVILAALAGAERIFELLDAPVESDDGYVGLVPVIENADGTLTETNENTGVSAWKHPHHDGTLTYTKLKGDVEFENVSFAYVDGHNVLKDISLNAKAGRKIALVGSTGAGKTTVTNLLNRFYDITQGKIRCDGINIGKIKKADLRRAVAMVLQDTHLFTGTVADNIRYGRLGATDEEVVAAAHLAHADFFIEALPQGYQTVLSADGANLSQGQRQLLAIARAAVARPSILVLDEATSSVDTRTEKLIEQGMDKLMQGRTVFVIAHRLSTVRNADEILVMEQGRVIERGNHDALIAARGRYYQLYTGMFELA